MTNPTHGGEFIEVFHCPWITEWFYRQNKRSKDITMPTNGCELGEVVEQNSSALIVGLGDGLLRLACHIE